MCTPYTRHPGAKGHCAPWRHVPKAFAAAKRLDITVTVHPRVSWPRPVDLVKTGVIALGGKPLPSNHSAHFNQDEHGVNTQPNYTTNPSISVAMPS